MKVLLTLFAFATSAYGQRNLIPNWNFADPIPLKTWRFDPPAPEAKGGSYVKQAMMQGKKCALLDLPAGAASDQGGKLEAALVPVEPGATYHAEVECMTWDFGAKILAEAYAPEPSKEEVRAAAADGKGHKLTLAGLPSQVRLPPSDGKPALLKVYHVQFPDPKAHSKRWIPVSRDFTIPGETSIDRQKFRPAYLTIKVLVVGGANAGKAYFTNFKLIRIKSPGGAEATKPGEAQH